MLHHRFEFRQHDRVCSLAASCAGIREQFLWQYYMRLNLTPTAIAEKIQITFAPFQWVHNTVAEFLSKQI